MREFSTAVSSELAEPEQSEVARNPLKTKIDGRPVTLHPLTSSQFVVVAYGLDSGSLMQNAAGILNAFFGMLKDEQDIRHFKARLWDTADPFGVEVISEVMRGAMEEWAGNPTQGSSGSSSSPENTGPSSTPTQPAEEPRPPSAFGSIGS